MRRKNMEQHQYLIKSPEAAVITPTPAHVGKLVTEILSEAEQTGKVINSIQIEPRSAEQVALFLGDNGKLAQVSPAEKPGLIGLPLNKKPDTPASTMTTPPPAGIAPFAAGTEPAAKHKPKGRAAQMLKAIAGITPDKALGKAELSKLSKIPDRLTGELLFRMHAQGIIGRLEDVKPFRYYDRATEAQPGTINCHARNGKTIPRDLCNPNSQLIACRGCKNYHD